VLFLLVMEPTNMSAPMVKILAATLLTALAATACSGAPGEDVAAADEAYSTHVVTSISTISYAPNSYVIGNAYPGWHDDVQGNAQRSAGPGNWGGASYRWGYLYGEQFNHCAWINDATAVGTHTIANGRTCGSPQEIDTPYFLAKYTDGIHNDLAGDGSETHMHYAGSGCTDHNGYGNVDPWEVPAVPRNSTGPVPDGRTLYWRYVSKDGHWVLVHDATNDGRRDEPNWYFVHRGCISLANGYEDSE
jgi:hypothetical protein